MTMDLLDKVKDTVNSAAGGGQSSEKDEDYLDEDVDYMQENFMVRILAYYPSR